MGTAALAGDVADPGYGLVGHLEENLAAATLSLPADTVAQLDAAA